MGSGSSVALLPPDKQLALTWGRAARVCGGLSAQVPRPGLRMPGAGRAAADTRPRNTRPRIRGVARRRTIRRPRVTPRHATL